MLSRTGCLACLPSQHFLNGGAEGKRTPLTDQRHLYCCCSLLSLLHWTRVDVRWLVREHGDFWWIIRVFFRRFIEFGSMVLYKRHVVAPESANDAAVHTKKCEETGLQGCVGLMDATHILLEKVEYRLCQSHLGFKSSHSCGTYNITVNNRRQNSGNDNGSPSQVERQNCCAFWWFYSGVAWRQKRSRCEVSIAWSWCSWQRCETDVRWSMADCWQCLSELVNNSAAVENIVRSLWHLVLKVTLIH